MYNNAKSQSSREKNIRKTNIDRFHLFILLVYINWLMNSHECCLHSLKIPFIHITLKLFQLIDFFCHRLKASAIITQSKWSCGENVSMHVPPNTQYPSLTQPNPHPWGQRLSKHWPTSTTSICYVKWKLILVYVSCLISFWI